MTQRTKNILLPWAIVGVLATTFGGMWWMIHHETEKAIADRKADDIQRLRALLHNQDEGYVLVRKPSYGTTLFSCLLQNVESTRSIFYRHQHSELIALDNEVWKVRIDLSSGSLIFLYKLDKPKAILER